MKNDKNAKKPAFLMKKAPAASKKVEPVKDLADLKARAKKKLAAASGY